jgi:hemolysin activation/secretion protein
LGSDGLAMNLFAGHVESRIDNTGTPLRSASDILTLGLSYPLVRSRTQTLRLRARLNFYNGTQDFREFRFVQEDMARALRIGAAWDRTDAGGVSFADAELSKGLSGLGSTRPAVDTAQRTNADYGFTKFNYFLGRLQHLGGNFSLQASVQGQWTRDPLPPSERAALGGELILRAFAAGELIGDRAQAAKLELRYEPALIPGGRLSFYGFLEAGRTRTLETLVPDTVQKGASTGLGVRGSLAGGLNFYLEAAQQHRRSNVVSTSRRRSHVFAGLSYEF